MEMSVIKIGSSRGIRIPKSILELVGNPSRFNLAVEGRKVILEPETETLAGWDEAADRLHKEGADRLVFDDTMDVDNSDWDW